MILNIFEINTDAHCPLFGAWNSEVEFNFKFGSAEFFYDKPSLW